MCDEKSWLKLGAWAASLTLLIVGMVHAADAELVFLKPAKKFTAAVVILLTGCLFLYSPIVLAGEVGQ